MERKTPVRCGMIQALHNLYGGPLAHHFHRGIKPVLTILRQLPNHV